MKYKVGDKVRIVTDKSKAYGWNSQGLMDKWLGKVMTIRKCDELPLGCIYWMEEDVEENCGNAWAWGEAMIEGLATDEPKHQITITSDGKTTTAVFTVDGREVKKGIAKCSPEDKFDFKVGAELAFERMWSKAEPKEKRWYFSREKFLAKQPECKISEEVLEKLGIESWTHEIDGKEVTFGEDGEGYCGEYKIEKRWCEYRQYGKEITRNDPNAACIG